MLTVYGFNVQAFEDRSRAFFEWMREARPDAICLQETGRPGSQFPAYARLDGYQIADTYCRDGPGRTGAAILSRRPIDAKKSGFCPDDSCRGRLVEVTLGNVTIASAYAHAHSTTDAIRRAARTLFNQCLGNYIRQNLDTSCILVMDANVALWREDVSISTQWSGPWASARYRTPILDAMRQAGWTDSYRQLHGNKRRATVWTSSNFATADGSEIGYGIDYQLVSKAVAQNVREAAIFKPSSWADRFSDHAPTFGAYDL